jgi:hypothetical protein
MIELKSTALADRKMVDLFSIDDAVYQMPVKVGANIALGYMRMVRTHGQEAAMGWALEKVLGTDAYVALMNCDEVEPQDLETIMQAVHDNVMGAVENPKGRGSRG